MPSRTTRSPKARRGGSRSRSVTRSRSRSGSPTSRRLRTYTPPMRSVVKVTSKGDGRRSRSKTRHQNDSNSKRKRASKSLDRHSLERQKKKKSSRKARQDRSGSKEKARRRRSRSASSTETRSRKRESRDETVAEGSSKSCSTTDLAKFTDALTSLLTGTRSRGSNFLDSKILPEFDAEEGILSAEKWVERVREHATTYGWDDKTTLYLAITKLKGNAKVWYDSLQYSILTWQAFSTALMRQFPDKENFGQVMDEATNYKCGLGQNLTDYCFAKLAKINKAHLEISESKIVNWIAYGIQDDQIRHTVLAANLKDVASLNNCLREFTVKRKPKDSDKTCYICKKKGHYKRDCPEKNGKQTRKVKDGKFVSGKETREVEKRNDKKIHRV